MTFHCKLRYFMDPHKIVFHLIFDIVYILCGLSSHVNSLLKTIMDELRRGPGQRLSPFLADVDTEVKKDTTPGQ